jgi:hypothetical protein
MDGAGQRQGKVDCGWYDLQNVPSEGREYYLSSSVFSGETLRVEFVSPKRGRSEASAAAVTELKVTSQLLRQADLLTSQNMVLTVAKVGKSASLLRKLIIASPRAKKRPASAITSPLTRF